MLQCSPDYAYGAAGFPAWGIQSNSVLVFEIEVLGAQWAFSQHLGNSYAVVLFAVDSLVMVRHNIMALGKTALRVSELLMYFALCNFLKHRLRYWWMLSSFSLGYGRSKRPLICLWRQLFTTGIKSIWVKWNRYKRIHMVNPTFMGLRHI